MVLDLWEVARQLSQKINQLLLMLCHQRTLHRLALGLWVAVALQRRHLLRPLLPQRKHLCRRLVSLAVEAAVALPPPRQQE